MPVIFRHTMTEMMIYSISKSVAIAAIERINVFIRQVSLQRSFLFPGQSRDNGRRHGYPPNVPIEKQQCSGPAPSCINCR